MTVAVAVVYDKQHGFLLWNNKRWKGYAFPMRHLEPGDSPEIAVLDALGDRDFPLSLPNATARYLECLGAFGYSEGVRVDTYYDYHVMEVDPGQAPHAGGVPRLNIPTGRNWHNHPVVGPHALQHYAHYFVFILQVTLAAETPGLGQGVGQGHV